MINQTTDYSIFKKHPLNREVNKNHVRNLVKSMENKLTFTLIKVDREMRIVDGQHRFEALRQLNKPINYVQDDFTAIDMINENTNSKNWGMKNFVERYANEGVKAYKDILGLSKIHNLSLMIIIAVVRGITSHTSSIHAKTNFNQELINGNFKFDENRIHIKLTKLNDVLNNFNLKVKPRYFILAILRMQKHKNYNHEQMVHKAELFNYMYEKRNTVEGYLELLEEIYNYKNREKVSFKY